jgi:hypothetical protein
VLSRLIQSLSHFYTSRLNTRPLRKQTSPSIDENEPERVSLEIYPFF